MKNTKIAVICLFVALFCFSCVSRTNESRNMGILANDEAVSSVKQEIADRENSLLANENDVFWTPSGTIWHGSTDCSYLANSKTIYHGSIEQAKLEGKERACEKCAKTDIDRLYEKLEKNEIQANDVFFTREGEFYHNDINCPEIIGADKIYYASISVAEGLGKNAYCNQCKDKE